MNRILLPLLATASLLQLVALIEAVQLPPSESLSPEAMPLQETKFNQTFQTQPPPITGTTTTNHQIRFLGIKYDRDAESAREIYQQILRNFTGDDSVQIDEMSSTTVYWHSQRIGSLGPDCPIKEIEQILSSIKANDTADGPYTRDFKMIMTEDFELPTSVDVEGFGSCSFMSRKRSDPQDLSSSNKPPAPVELTTTIGTTIVGGEEATTVREPEPPATTQEPATSTPGPDEEPASSSESSSQATALSDETTTAGSFEMMANNTEINAYFSSSTTTTTTTQASTTVSEASSSERTLSGLFRDSSIGMAADGGSLFDDTNNASNKSSELNLDDSSNSNSTNNDDRSTELSDDKTESNTPSDATTTTLQPTTMAAETATNSSPSPPTDNLVKEVADGDEKPHYGKYIGLASGFLLVVAYLVCSRAYRRQSQRYELHNE